MDLSKKHMAVVITALRARREDLRVRAAAATGEEWDAVWRIIGELEEVMEKIDAIRDSATAW